MDLYIKEKNNPFTRQGLRVFMKRDLPAITMIVIVCFMLFFLFAKQTFLVAPAQKEMAWASREIAILHALSISIFSFLLLIKRVSFNSWHIALNITRGYIVADSLMIICYPEISSHIYLDIIHHVTLFFITLYAYKGPHNMALGLTTEVALCPLYFSWYMLKWNMQGQRIFVMVSAITLILYAIRICIFIYLLIKVWRQYLKGENDMDIIQPAMFVPITMMNCSWFYKLVQHAPKFLF